MSTQIPSEDATKPRKSNKFSKVPPFKVDWQPPSLSVMNDKARSFYSHWLERWSQDDPIDIDGNVDYLWLYICEVLSWRDVEKRLQELKRLLRFYSYEDGMDTGLRGLISDTYVLMGCFNEAFQALRPPVDFLNEGKYISLKRRLGLSLEGVDVLHFRDDALTDFGWAYRNDVASALTEIIREQEKKTGVNLLEKLTKRYQMAYLIYETHYLNTVRSVSVNIRRSVDLVFYFFDRDKCYKFITEAIVREAENRVRERKGVPKIGEGWVSEAELKNIVSDLLEPLNCKVLYHASPEWLEGQHLDIYVPSLHFAIEYMGKQHFEPLEFFGGMGAFRCLQKLDDRKKNICLKKKVTLIYFRYDEPLDREHVRNRIIKETGLDPNLIKDSTEQIQSEQRPSYKAARNLLILKNEKVVHVKELVRPKWSIRELSQGDMLVRRAIEQLADGNFDEGCLLLEKANQMRAEEAGLNSWEHVAKEELRKDFRDVDRYVLASENVLRRTKAEYAVGKKVGFVGGHAYDDILNGLKGGLLFEDFKIPKLNEQISGLIGDRHPSEEMQWLKFRLETLFGKLDAKILDRLTKTNWYSWSSTANSLVKAHGLSGDAKTILALLISRNKDVYAVKDLTCGGTVQFADGKAINELERAGLVLVDENVPVRKLLQALTFEQLKRLFIKNDLASGYDYRYGKSKNKKDYIEQIVQKHSEKDVRTKAHNELQDSVVQINFERTDELRKLLWCQEMVLRILSEFVQAQETL